MAYSTRMSVGFLVLVTTLSAELSMEARVMATGRFENGQSAILVRATIRNHGPGNEELRFMSCSWYQSWQPTENSGWQIMPWECLANFRTKQTLAEGESMTFEFPLCPTKPAAGFDSKPEPLRVGFANHAEPAADAPRLWSEPLTLPPAGDRILPANGTRMAPPPPTADCLTALDTLLDEAGHRMTDRFYVGPITRQRGDRTMPGFIGRRDNN